MKYTAWSLKKVVCPECGSELDYLGEVSAEQLELVSSALKVIRTVRVKKACTKCDCIV
ncbi:IS66 family transposase zinc-finger binding domain-containing protein (plasmid) [Escherichia coli]|nr:IS66 family transposase zinc-finger binding domain-containing protein [Escherichia coli]